MSDGGLLDKGRAGALARRVGSIVYDSAEALLRPGIDDEIIVAALAPQPVDVLRPEDLLLARFSFTDLRFCGYADDGTPLLGRATTRRPGFLTVTFPPQHVIERAFFRHASVAVKPPPTPHDKPGGVGDPDIETTGPNKGKQKGQEPLLPAPVFASAAGLTRLVFRVRDEVIAYSTEGLLAAMSTLELSVAPHAAPPPDPFPLRYALDLGALFAEDLGAARRSRSKVRRAPLVSFADPDEIVAYGRMAATWRDVARRFGPDAAARAVAAGRLGDRLSGAVIGAIDPGRIIDVRPPWPRRPNEHETAIELPWRLVLSPHVRLGWAHSTAAVDHDGRVELWHTRLGSRRVPTSGEPYVAELVDDPDRTVRAIWARDFDEVLGPPLDPKVFPNVAGHQPESNDFPDAGGADDRPHERTSLNSRDRMMLVHETSNFHLVRRETQTWDPEPVPTKRMMLTALGGWLDSRVTFDTLPDGGLTIEEWKHLATLGRDHAVKVVYAGFLLPFGHKASLVKLTERQLVPGRPDIPAYLYQRMFIIVRERDKDYRQGFELPDHEGRADLVNPLASVHIETAVTPDIDVPANLERGGGSGMLFVPYVSGEAFPFKVLAVDREGHQVELRAPLAFMERDLNKGSYLSESLSSYSGTRSDNKAQATEAERRMVLGGQRIAFAAKGAKVDDTVLKTDNLYFRAVALPKPGAVAQDDPRFLPVLDKADTVVPAMSALAGAAKSVAVRYPQKYKDGGFGGNPAEVFLELVTSSKLDFGSQSDRSGGLVTPSLDVTGLSRLTGPVGGELKHLMADGVPARFDPKEFFKGIDAQLFGVVPLTDLLDAVGFDASRVPTFVAQALDVASALSTNVKRIGNMASELAATLGATATSLKAAVDAFATHLGALAADPANPPNLVGDLDTIKSRLATFVTAVDGAAQLPRAQRDQVVGIGRQVQGALDDTTIAAGLLVQMAQGLKLPEVVTARLDWKTPIPAWGLAAGKPILQPTDAAGDDVSHGELSLAVEVQAPTKAGGTPAAIVSCSITPFDLHLIAPVTFITLRFEKLEFSVTVGKKPDVNVVFRKGGIVFDGPLSFVNNLKSIIPFDGFSDPPYLDVTSEGVKAGFDLAIPNLAVGVFSLDNISLGAHFNVPFIGESLEVGFSFCTRDNPFHLTVMLFGGGGFFGVTLTPKGVRVLEAALEFGAALSMNFGVASGGVSVMAGIYFKMEMKDGHDSATLAGYFRVRGEVDVLGLISASIELYLELSYETATHKAVGRASLTIEVEVLFLSFSVSISCEKKFAGDANDPTFEQQMGLPAAAPAGATRPWDQYCTAFAD